jgi:hypothetical protein
MPIWLDWNDELAAVDQRLQDAHGAVVEEEGVVVVRRAAEEFDVPRLHREALFRPATSDWPAARRP